MLRFCCFKHHIVGRSGPKVVTFLKKWPVGQKYLDHAGLKNFGHSQKTLGPPWYPKLVTGLDLITNYYGNDLTTVTWKNRQKTV